MAFLDSLTALVGKAAKLLPAWAQPFRAPPSGPCTPAGEVRQVALEALRDYLAAVDVHFPNGRVGQIAKDDIFVTASDDHGGGSELALPALGMAGGAAEDELLHLGPPDVDDDTWGIAGPGTALAWTGDYRERVTIEVWASDPEERSAVVQALRRAFRPADGMGTLVLELAKYFDVLARFTLAGSQVVDDQDAARNRRRVLLQVDVEAAVVELVGAAKLQPRVRAEVEQGPDECDDDEG